jgi:MOSC domain-containing protein YiiM
MNNQSSLLLSIQVGQPVTYPSSAPDQKPWTSAIVKSTVTGPVWLGPLGVEGDAQYNLVAHGGIDRAVNVYPSENLDFWRTTPGLAGMAGGAFGENFTTRGLVETEVCIGDVFRVGDVLVEVSQPRGPCNTLNRRWRSPDLMQRATTTGRVGWYLRVRQPGRVQAGAAFEILEHPFPQWTIARVWAFYRDPLNESAADLEAIRQLAACPALSEGWREVLGKKAANR